MMQTFRRTETRRGTYWKTLALLVALAAAANAQPQAPPAAPQAPVGPAAPAAPVESGSDAGGSLAGQPFAPPAGGAFYRGNRNFDPLANANNPTPVPRITFEYGFYLGFFKLGLVVALFLFWVHTSNWVFEDSRDLKIRPVYWNSMQLVGGTSGLLMVNILPMYLLGLFALLGMYGGPLGLYVHERNQRVPENARVLTPEHIRRWAIRQLARVGIRIGSREEIEASIGPSIQLVGKTKTGRKDESRGRQVENSKGFLACKELIYDAIQRRATDIHLEPKEDELSCRLRIDGVMFPTDPFDRAVGESIVNIIKVLCAMDITERRRPQDGSFGALLENREIDFRVASQGTSHGEKVSMRILDQSNSVSRLKDLGMRQQMLDRIKAIIRQPHGMFLVCGPTGAGKSTTLYAALNDLDASEVNIITIEDPVEYKMDQVTQIEINTKAGQSFGGSLRSVLRQDPDVVMIGEIRDEETAKIACQAANTGHMVFSTVHANDTITALYRLLDLGVEPFMISTSISAILGQRLARRLCPHCREAYKPNPELLKAAGLPAEKIEHFYRPPTKRKEHCTHCGDMGYRGRIGIYEFLEVNDRMRDQIRDKAAVSAIQAEARKNGMLYMREEGLRLVIRGVTSMDEVLRVVK
jgi:type II secretory ATPase GspE/PulE/Tfp pilus assembly ATPase PilB-like protein